MNHNVKKPVEENIWWEGTTLHIRCEDDSEWEFTHAQMVSHTQDLGDGSVCTAEPVEIRCEPLEFDLNGGSQ